MGKAIASKKPCIMCKSSDALTLYDTQTAYCFSCNTGFNKEQLASAGLINEGSKIKINSTIKPYKPRLEITQIAELKSIEIKDRKISKEITEFFKVKASFSESGFVDAFYYPYDNGEAYKVRNLPKAFQWVNKSNSLFGKELFNAGGRRLVITEGEVDALSVAQAGYDKYKKIYPVVSLSSASNVKSLIEHRAWIRSFGEVVLCLDSDEAGRKATEEAIKIIGLDKAKTTKLSEKDASDVLTKHGGYALLQAIFDAHFYIPSGIITKENLWQALESYTNIVSVPYPSCLNGVNEKLKGMRAGEITLFISGTGCGKSSVLREIMLHLITNTEDKIGIVSLEESPAETARKLSGMAINKNPANEEIPLDQLKEGFDKVFGDDRVILLDHQGSMNDTSIVDKLEYMCLKGCKYLFIDHITILVSEGVENLTGLEAQDKVMNDLLRISKRHHTWIGLVSHLRKSSNNTSSFEEGRLPNIDDIRGSGSIKQISFDIVAFARNLTAPAEQERNTIKMRVLKSRFTGLTGTVKGCFYNYLTGRLSALDEDVEFTPIED